jgi:hypothetical protein
MRIGVVLEGRSILTKVLKILTGTPLGACDVGCKRISTCEMTLKPSITRPLKKARVLHAICCSALTKS